MRERSGRGSRLRHRWCVLVAVGILSSVQAVLGAGIYTWKDSDGAVHFGDRPPPTAAATSVEVKANVVEGPRAIEQLDSVMADRPTAPPAHSPHSVTIYTTSHCGYCKKAKAYFRAHDIAFQERDVEASPEAQDEYRRLGGGGVPLILVGKRVLHGFSESSFRRAYGSD